MNPNIVVYPNYVTTTHKGKVYNRRVHNYNYEIYSPTSGKLMGCGVADTDHGARTRAGIKYAQLIKYYVIKKT